MSCALMTLKPWRSVAEATIGVRRPRGEMAGAVAALTVVVGHDIPNEHALAGAPLVVHAFGANAALGVGRAVPDAGHDNNPVPARAVDP